MNVKKIREDFAILTESEKKGLFAKKKKIPVYLDNACMSLKPNAVVEAINRYYYEFPACAGRSSHRLAKEVELKVADARLQISKLINSKKAEQCVFTRNTTEAINIVANGIRAGDEVIISDKEHNSNLIPWLNKKARLKIVQSDSDNTFNMDAFEKLLTKNTKLVSITHTSNLDGVENPIKEIAKLAHDYGAKVLIDGAQGVPGKVVDVKSLNCDYLAFSGHKMLGPTGTGILYGKEDALEELPQFIVGGETVLDSTYDSFVKEHVPMKFEGGLQDYANIIGFGEAAKYLRAVGLDEIKTHEIKLNEKITSELNPIKELEIIGPKDAKQRSGIFSFNLKQNDGKLMDYHHIAGILNSNNIMVRSGAHCVHSWFNKRKMPGSVRASLYLYNDDDDVEKFISSIKDISKLI